MITAATVLYLYVETPLHAGVGSGLSSIDLPIQRERTTQYPMIQGSGIKGKLRATAEEAKDKDGKRIFSDEEIDILFGPSVQSGKGSEHAGALIIGDARILLFPVRSLNGVFAYTSSSYVLNRFKRDLEREGPQNPLPTVPGSVAKDSALITSQSEISITTSDNPPKLKVVLEEFSFTAQTNEQTQKIAEWIAQYTLPEIDKNSYWAGKLQRSLAILPDNDFGDFVLYATEVITRVKLNRTTKTVDTGALWTEEHLPTDTLLYVPVYATESRKNGRTMDATVVLKKIKALNGYLQLGGDETVGRGIVRMRWETRADQ